MNDCTIIEQLKKGNDEVIGELIDKYSKYLSAVIFKRTGPMLSSQDIEEVLSDVFLAVWKSRCNLHETESLKPYLAQIARNLAKNKIRDKKMDVPLDDEVLIFNCGNNAELHCMEEKAVLREEISEIKNFIGSMDYPDKEILYAYYFWNYKQNVIAEMFSLPLSTVKSKIYRGRKNIIQKFEKRGYKYES